MLSLHPFSFLFLSTLGLSTMMALSSNNWIIIWASMELNLLSMVPLITLSATNQETEAAMKYFFAQAIGSASFLLAILPSFAPTIMFLFPKEMFYIFFLFSLLIKTGAAPCHYWLPNVMSGLAWPICLILTTWQKIIPVWLLIHLPIFSSSFLPLLIASIGALIGGAGGINQTQLRPLLAYSSINHTGWIIATASISSYLSISYFSVYVLSLIPIMGTLSTFTTKSSNQLSSFSKFSPQMKLLLMIMFLSLGGLPPLLGFFPKLISLMCLIKSQFLIIPIMLILGSLMSLYYYLTIFFNVSLMTGSLNMFSNMFMTYLAPYSLILTSLFILCPFIISFL